MKNKSTFFALTLLAHTGSVYAQYELYDGSYGQLSVGLHVQLASLAEINNHSGGVGGSWGRENLSEFYWEHTVEPNVKGFINLPRGSQLYSGFSMIYSAMLGHDPSGITYRGSPRDSRERGDFKPYPDYKDWFMAEEKYIGWRSGTWFEGLGENAIDLSAGSQDYKLGTGLLLANGTDDGGFRGSYWIGSRTVFINTLIARINTGGFKLEGFYLENNPRNPDNRKRYTGMNIEYNYQDIANFAFSYINDHDFGEPLVAITDAYDFRLDFKPFATALPGLSISTEYVRQYNNKLTDSDPADPTLYWYGEMGKKTVSGGFGQIEYKFSDLTWQPALSYRYSAMGKGFDFMNFGFKTWGTWFQGEITGEFISDTTNLFTHLTRLVVSPRDDVTVNLLYYHFDFDDPEVWGVSSPRFGNEVDLIADWSVNNTVDLSAGIETFIPDNGGKEVYGGNKMWIQGMVYASFKF
ncbi:MAG: hypothetical protein PHH11_07910 [Methylomonas sp.]|nr:hypothetical protein [Methylomonas sp.]